MATSSSGISFSGLSSGLDTDSIVTALTRAESSRRTVLQTKQNGLKVRQAAYTTVKAQLSAVARAAGTLNTASTYASIQATTGDADVATISASSASAVGTFDLSVTALAKANKVASAPQADATTALGRAGTVAVNGKAMKIEAGDSLATVAQKINSLSAGVTASIVDGGAGRAYLTVSSGTTGAASAVALADLGGTALTDLGLIDAGASIRQPGGNTAVGFAFSSKSNSLESVLGASDLGATSITIGGTSVSVDPSTDTLDDLATKINAAGAPGVSASVEASTKDGATVYALKIARSGATPPAMTDGGGLLSALGVLRATPKNPLVPGQDASYSLDGVPLTSPSNTVTSAIAGATLTLKKEDDTTITLTKDSGAVTTAVKSLVSAANSLFGTIKSYSSFDAKTYDTGVLFGDRVATQARDSVRSLLFSDSPGISGSLRNLASVGLGLDTDGNVTLDDATFQKALDRDPKGVQALLQSVGTGSTSSIKFVSATPAAQASDSANPYDVTITQPATKASLVAGTAQTGPRATAETLTFRGAAFGTTGIAVDLEAGTDLAATVAKINGDGRLKELVAASIENGRLRIDGKRYGSVGDFTLASNFASSATNSGVGVGGEGTYSAAQDVAGTIANEAATGNGQFLTGKTGNAHTEGLQILYSGTATGSVGTLSYSRGAGSRMIDLVNGFTDSTKGLFTAADTSLQKQIDSLDKDMTTIDDRLASKTTELKSRFSAMEDAIAKLKQQSGTLSSMLGTNSSG